MTAAFSWDTTQRVVAIHHRRFGITHRPHLQGSRIPKIYAENHIQKKGERARPQVRYSPSKGAQFSPVLAISYVSDTGGTCCAVSPANGLHSYSAAVRALRTLNNPLKTKRRLPYLKTQFVPRSKHFSSRL